jgi:multiple sugar transport system substrate-binding protein
MATNEVAIPKPTIPESPQITDILVRELSSFLAGDKSAQAALDTAALEMHDLLGDCAPMQYPVQ